ISIYPTNFYIEKGDKSLDEIIKDIDEGLMVTSFAGLHSGANSNAPNKYVPLFSKVTPLYFLSEENGIKFLALYVSKTLYLSL
ncbi:metallopeptidase TldD-related protein, partial [Clostridioides difficile]